MNFLPEGRAPAVKWTKGKCLFLRSHPMNKGLPSPPRGGERGILHNFFREENSGVQGMYAYVCSAGPVRMGCLFLARQ